MSLPGFTFNITGASGATGLLGPKNSYRCYVFPRGGYAAQDSTGTKITFDSASVASRFAVGNWIQSGLLTANIRQVGAVGGNSLTVSGAALTVTTNDRIYLIGNTEPTVNGGSATYTTPNTIVRQRDDDAATLYANSMLTTNTDGMVQGFAVTALYDLLIQDGNRANQGSLIDLPVGVPEGISVSDWAFFGSTATFAGNVGITGSLTVGSSITAKNIGCIRYTDLFATGSSTGGIQEAINDLPVGGGVVSLCNGTTYQPTVAITIKTGTRINGNGATIQRVAGTDALSVFKDSGSAIGKIAIRDIVFDNNSRAVSGNEDILLTGGCSDVIVEGCRWINLTNRTEDLTRIGSAASKGERIAFRNNTVVGPGSQQTYNSFQIIDCDNVDVSGNIIDGWGAIKLEGSLAANLYNWNVVDNRMKSVHQTNIFTRIQSASSVRGIVISDNTLIDCGKTGMAVDIVSASDTGTMTDITITGNVINGFGLATEDDAIQVGGVLSTRQYMTGVVVSDNVINGLKSDGTFTGSPSRGISAEAGMGDCVITGNVVRNTGRSGIGISSVDTDVTGNKIDRCVRTDTSASPPSAAQEGGIAVFDINGWTASDIVIAHNHITNCGVSGATTTQAITVAANSATNPPQRIYVYGNRCYDDQATPTQTYGIMVGANGIAGPNDCLIYNNDVRGNSTAGIGKLGTGARNMFQNNIETNSGTPATLTQAASLTLPYGDLFFGISGTLGAGTSISNITQSPGREVIFWAAAGTVGFSVSNTLRVVGNSINVPVNGAVKAFCTGTTWFVFSPSS